MRLCVHSIINDDAHPIGRLGNFRGVFLRPKRVGVIHFGVTPRVLQCCGCSLRLITRPNSFRIVVNAGDHSIGATGFALGWAFVALVVGSGCGEVVRVDTLPLVLLFLSTITLAFRDYGKGDGDGGLSTTASSLSSSTLVSAIRQQAFLCF